MKRSTSCALTLLMVATLVSPALAHPGHLGHDGLSQGFMHPLTGADHFIAMLTVGVWAGVIGGRALWVVPAAFVSALVFGFGLAVAGYSLPLVEPMILASVVTLGLLTALGFAAPVPGAAALVGVFAVFHGYAHGSELGGVQLLPFLGGFLFATIVLHSVGIALALAIERALTPTVGRGVVRALGLAGALAGLAMVVA